MKMENEMNEIWINLLPMQSGDCIHLRFGRERDWHNIVIDSGPAGCAAKFRRLLTEIKAQGEIIDLLCFTHMDDDHIKGAERVLSSATFDANIVKKIWINLPSEKIKNLGVSGSYTPVTAKSACSLWDAIRGKNLTYKAKVSEGDCLKIGDADIKVLLPTEKRLLELKQYWDEEIEELHSKGKYLALSGWKEDDSPTNGSSITLLISIDDKKLLFAGDAFPEDLKMACKKEVVQKIHVMKLPHHGSERNITMDMIKATKCRHFLISTKETAYRPATQTMELLSKYGGTCGGVKVYGNYTWPRFADGFDNMEIITLQGSNVQEDIEGIIITSE